MRIVSLLVLTALAAGCSTAPPPPEMRSVAAQAKLNRTLAGLVPGPPQACLAHQKAGDMIVVDDHTVLFRDGASRVYRNDFDSAGCPMLSGPYALSTRTTGPGLCQGDIAQVVDTRNGFSSGSCVFGPFIPYRRP